MHPAGEGKGEGVVCAHSVGGGKGEGVMCSQLEKERERGSRAEAAAKTLLKEERELGALS